ncbi:MAG: hypothetical protein FWF22_07715 [Treponema sp.]|nr:hypothetical protein [Treponema sp.]
MYSYGTEMRDSDRAEMDRAGVSTITAVDGETPLRTVYDGMGFDTVLQIPWVILPKIHW